MLKPRSPSNVPLLLGAAVFFLLPVGGVPGQVVPPVLIQEDAVIPPEYEDSIRDLVERYEDLREQLRAEIRRSADMYTRAELDDAVRDVERDLLDAQARLVELEARLKESLLLQRRAEEKARRFKTTLAKTERGLLRELETTERIVDAMDVERVFQVGPTFSPSGTVGALGIINLPGTPLSVVAGTDYHLREQEWTSKFGVTFSFFSQQSIVDAWIRLRGRERDKAELTADELRAIRARNSRD